MPRLVRGARKWDVESDFDDPVIGTEHALAYRHEPGVGGDVDEAADAFGMHLHIETLGTARQRAAGHHPRLVEQREDVAVQAIRPVGCESTFQRDDAVAVEAAHDRSRIIFGQSDAHTRPHPHAFRRSPNACRAKGSRRRGNLDQAVCRGT